MKRILAVVLMFTLLLGNTMSVSAASSSPLGNLIEEIDETVAETEENVMVSEECSEETTASESEKVSEETDEETIESVTEEVMEEATTEAVTAESVAEIVPEQSTENMTEEEPLLEQTQSATNNASTDKIIDEWDLNAVYYPESPIDVSEMDFSFTSEKGEAVSSLNDSTEKYRLLLFAPVEAYKNESIMALDNRGLWQDFYFYNALLLSSSYVDMVVLDTGRSKQSVVKDIHTAAKTFNSGDTSVFCYDTTADEESNTIWKAYNEYCDLFEEMVPATHYLMEYSGETAPCAGYFLINERNQLVLAGYGDTQFHSLWEYIKDDAIVKPAAPDNITVTNMQGKVTFSWTMADEANTAEAYYILEDEDGKDQVLMDPDQDGFKYNGKEVTYVINTDATGEENNPVCRYQFREVHTNDYGVKSEYSDTVSNEGMECPQNPELIKEARFIDTRIAGTTDRTVDIEDGIKIHVGETVKMDVEIERYSTAVETPEVTDEFYWYLGAYEDGEINSITDGGPVKYWVESFEDMTGIYLKGEELTGDTTYYMVCEYEDAESSFCEEIIVPVHVIAAEPGVTYDEQEKEIPDGLYLSVEALQEAVATHLKNGDEEFSVTVNSDDWYDWGISVTTLGMPQAFWDEEPWSLNYLYILGGTILEPMDDRDYESVRYKGDYYYTYKFLIEYDDSYGGYYAPYEWLEEQVDKLVNQPGGALYAYKNADEYTRIKAVYDWVRKNVSYIGTEDSLYHSAYGAMKKKEATCEGYQQLTYRLLWEMGIPNGCMTDDYPIGSTIGTVSVHAYNLVELVGKAYYLDASGGLFLKGTKSVGLRAYQEFFYDNCKRYIDILSEEDYVYVPRNLQLSKITDGEQTTIGFYSSFESVKEAIDDDMIENGGVAAERYIIFMTDNMELSDDSLNNSDKNINLDLNGHTLKVTSDAVSTACINGGSAKTGSVKLAENVTFTVKATANEAELENVTLAYEGTNATLVLGTEDSEQMLTLKNLVSATANQLKITGNVEYTGSMTAKELVIDKGRLSADVLKVSGMITLDSGDVLRVRKAEGIKDVELKSGALFIADNFTQTSSGKFYAWADSVFVVNEKAKIYNPVLNAETDMQEPVHIYRTKEAEIDLLGKLTRTAPQTLISVGNLEQNISVENGTEASIVLRDYAEKTALFDTTISKFPLDVVRVEQASADSASEYNVIYQTGTTIYVGKIVFKASGTNSAGLDIEEKGFAKWSEAVAYLNLAGKNAKCVIKVDESIETMENFTLPGKAASIVICTDETESMGITPDRISLTCLGDISLSSTTTIENIDLFAKKYNSKTATYDDYKSALKLNGKALTFKNASAALNSVAGNSKATLTMNNAEISVVKAVSSLGYLHMTNSYLGADNVTVSNTLVMDSAQIDCVTKITLNNVVSESEGNVLAYGGNSSKNILTVKGNITFAEDADKKISLNRKENEEIIIRKNAIDLKLRTMEEAGYTEGAVLCSAQKAGSSWFVVGSEYNEAGERTAVTYGTYKNGKNILCGEMIENVNLYSSKTGADNSYVLEGGFKTLQDALSEIDKIAIKENHYQVELMKSDKDVVTFTNKALTFPSKTAGITIMADRSMEESLPDPRIYFKGNLTLKSDTSFEEIVFAPVKNASISLGNFSLTLSECGMNPDNAAIGFSQISGTGVKKNSTLVLDDTKLCVLGNVNNVGKLVFRSAQGEEAELISYGTVNVGNVELGTDAVLGGLATVTRKKVAGASTVTKITSKITIGGNVTSDTGRTLYLDLYEKVGKVYQQLDFDNSDMDTIENSGIQMAKGLLVIYPNIKALQRENAVGLIKSAGYLIWYPDEHGAELKFEADNGEILIPCLTIGDAITEINNQKMKRDYIITLTEAGNETSGAVQNGASFVPKLLKMPTAKYINSLVLEGENTSGIQLGYLSNITFTCNTIVRDINFMQMVKVKNKYLTMDEAKVNYPAAVTVNTGGFALNIEGIVTFNTPLVLNGKNTGTLTLNGEGDTAGTIATLTNQNDIVTAGENVIFGSVTAFKELNVMNCDLTLSEYKSSATSKAFKASANKVTNLNLTDGIITVIGEKAKGSFTVSGDANIDSGELVVGGKVSLKNVTLEGGPTPKIQADTDFTISGILTSKSNNATLETRRKGVNKAPYLNVKGNVILEDGVRPIYVGVYQPVNVINADEPVKLTNAPQVTAQLLTAAKAPAEVFRPIGDNTSGRGEYSEDNPKGYWVGKVKSNIYVYEGK